MANLLTSWQRYDKQYVQTLIVGSKCSSRSADSNGQAITNLGATAFKKGSAVKVVRGGSSGSYTYTITQITSLQAITQSATNALKYIPSRISRISSKEEMTDGNYL